jgi:hypothetical protein
MKKIAMKHGNKESKSNLPLAFELKRFIKITIVPTAAQQRSVVNEDGEF